MTATPIVDGTALVMLDPRDQQRLAEFCGRCTQFFELVGGEPGGEATATELLGPLPEPFASGTRRVFGVEADGALEAVVELLEGFPGSRDWYVGLLVLLPELRGRGRGTTFWHGVRDWMAGRGATSMRLIVQKQNAAARTFWEKQGFTVEDEVVTNVGAIESAAWKMVLHLGAAPAAGCTPTAS